MTDLEAAAWEESILDFLQSEKSDMESTFSVLRQHQSQGASYEAPSKPFGFPPPMFGQ